MSPDGVTAVRDAVMAVARRLPADDAAAMLADVVPGPVPVCAAAAVTAWETLHSTRGEGLSSVKPLTLHDVRAYSEMVQPLTPRDVSWVLTQDAAFRDEVSKEAARG